jgi:hypothetical protein
MTSTSSPARADAVQTAFHVHEVRFRSSAGEAISNSQSFGRISVPRRGTVVREHIRFSALSAIDDRWSLDMDVTAIADAILIVATYNGDGLGVPRYRVVFRRFQ